MVDRALPATHVGVGSAVVKGEFTVKQLFFTALGHVMRAAHPEYTNLHIKPGQEFSIWGIVQWNVHKVKICRSQ